MTSPSSAAFHTTRWTRVCLARSNSEQGRQALADLCDAYYEPVVAFLRCEWRDAEAAREVAHAFFADLLAGERMPHAQPERGRFRAYLLGAVKHFLSHQRQAAQCQKRGGGQSPLSLDDEAVMTMEDGGARSPEAEFDRQWALTVLAKALERLRDECRKEGRECFFEQARPWLTGEAEAGDHAALAEACGLSVAACKMAVHRLRQRFRQQVKAEVADTLEEPGQVAEEMLSLFAALSR